MKRNRMTYNTSHGCYSHKNTRALSMDLHTRNDCIQTDHRFLSSRDGNVARTQDIMDPGSIPKDLASHMGYLLKLGDNHKQNRENIAFYR